MGVELGVYPPCLENAALLESQEGPLTGLKTQPPICRKEFLPEFSALRSGGGSCASSTGTSYRFLLLLGSQGHGGPVQSFEPPRWRKALLKTWAHTNNKKTDKEGGRE